MSITFSGLYSTVTALANRGNRLIIDGMELTDALWNPVEGVTKIRPGSARLVITGANVLPESGAIVNFVNETTGTETNAVARWTDDGTYHVEVPESLPLNATFSVVVVTDSGYGVAPGTLRSTSYPNWSVQGNVTMPALFSNNEQSFTVAGLGTGVTTDVTYLDATDLSTIPNVNGQTYTISVGETGMVQTGNNAYTSERMNFSISVKDDYALDTLSTTLDLVQTSPIDDANVFPGHKMLVRQGNAFITIGEHETAQQYGFALGVASETYPQTTVPGAIGVINDPDLAPKLPFDFSEPRYPIRLPRNRFPSSWSNTIVDISIGYGGGIACDVNGHVWVWGYPGWYTATFHNVPVGCNPFNVSTYDVPGNELFGILPKIVKVRCSTYNAYPSLYAIGDNGRVWAWGYNGHGQLATGDTTHVPLPRLIPSGPTNIIDVQTIQTGTIYLTADGDVWVNGRNVSYGLGGGLTLNANHYGLKKIYGAAGQVFEKKGLKIYASQKNMWVLTAAGLYGWGYNAQYQLGTNNTSDYGSYVQYALTSQGYTIQGFAVKPTTQTQCALLCTREGTQRLYMWGYRGPMLGNQAYLETDQTNWTKHDLLDKTTIQGSLGDAPALTDVYMDMFHVYALDEAGVMHTWGRTPDALYSGGKANVTSMVYMHPDKYRSQYPYPYWTSTSANIVFHSGMVESNLIANLSDVVDSANLVGTIGTYANIDANLVDQLNVQTRAGRTVKTTSTMIGTMYEDAQVSVLEIQVPSTGFLEDVSSPFSLTPQFTGTVSIRPTFYTNSYTGNIPDRELEWGISVDGNVGNLSTDTIQTVRANVGSTLQLVTRPTNSSAYKLFANDGQTSAQFGYHVSISGDGNHMVVGAFNHTYQGLANSGAAYVYSRSGNAWKYVTTLVPDDPEASDNFGISVSMNVDGTRLVVGSRLDDDGANDSGSAYIFAFDGTTWTQQQKITAPDPAASDHFGTSVSINADGTRLVVGERYDDDGGTNRGAAFVFTFDGTTWTEQQKITAFDAMDSAYFGDSVSMNDDGTRLVVGAYADDPTFGDSGSVYPFSYDGTTWTHVSGRAVYSWSSIEYSLTSDEPAAQTQLYLTGNVATDTHVYNADLSVQATDSQGKSGTRKLRMDLLYNDYVPQLITSPDPQENGEFGGAYQYHPAENNYRKWARGAVDMTDDGIWMVVGEPHVQYDISGTTYTKAGRAHVYKRETNGVYTLHTTLQLTPTTLEGTATNDMRFGYSVCVCKTDNTRLLVGAIGENTYGMVHVYERVDDAWTHKQSISPSQTGNANYNWFGSYLAFVTPEKFVVTQTSLQGSVYIYDWDEANQLYQEVFEYSVYNNRGPQSKYPGPCAITLDGNTMVVSHNYDNGKGMYVSYFKLSETTQTWTWVTWLTHNQSGYSDDGYHLGDVQISRNGKTLVAGFPGSAYVYSGTSRYAQSGWVMYWYWNGTSYVNWASFGGPWYTSANTFHGKCLAVSQRIDYGGSGTTGGYGVDDYISDLVVSSHGKGGPTNGGINYLNGSTRSYGGRANTNRSNYYNDAQYFPTGSGAGQALSMDLSGDTLAVGLANYASRSGAVQIMRKQNINLWKGT